MRWGTLLFFSSLPSMAALAQTRAELGYLLRKEGNQSHSLATQGTGSESPRTLLPVGGIGLVGSLGVFSAEFVL